MAPMFRYFCTACGNAAKHHINVIKVEGPDNTTTSGRTLGTWSCACQGRHQKTKVRRERAPQKEA